MATLTLLPEIATPNLIVREMTMADASALAAYMIDPRYRRYLDLPRSAFRNEHGPLRLVVSACAEQRSPNRRHFLLAAEAADTGRVIGDGFIALTRNGMAEIGWGVDPRQWGRNLGVEIARAMTGLAIERLKAQVVVCKVMAPNDASRRVAERAGFSAMRPLPAYRTGDGRVIEVHRYRLSRESYFDQPY